MVKRHRFAAQQAAADRKKKIAAERRKMAKQDPKTLKVLEARRIAFFVAGKKKKPTAAPK
jgi:hypothetical protein